MPSEPFDARSQLRLGDQLAREGKYAQATRVYQSVASYYLVQGFALKAVAVSKQILQIIDQNPAVLSDYARPALLVLVDGYRALGLVTEAVAAEARLRELGNPS